jgi:hypothetical protein
MVQFFTACLPQYTFSDHLNLFFSERAPDVVLIRRYPRQGRLHEPALAPATGAEKLVRRPLRSADANSCQYRRFCFLLTAT